MPEGHTIHRIAMDHTRALRGQCLRVTSPQGRFADGAALLDGSVLERIEAWGKHLFYRFPAERYLHIHLGLYGKFWPWTPPAAGTHRQVRVRLEGGRNGYDLTGPTACDVIDAAERAAIVGRLGPDPIRTDADGGAVMPKLARRRSPIGAAVMDQSVVAGVGNVYRAESLFVHAIHPQRPANTITADEWGPLWDTMVRMLREGVRARRIVTVDPHDETITDGRLRYVYKQDHCGRCGTPVRRWDLAGRWSYACEICQPPWTGG
jgi:endonuclease-8